MDGERFDRITKSLSAGLTRRRVLGGLISGGAALAGTGAARADIPPVCGQSSCKAACTSAGFSGQQCNVICGGGQSTGACPVGQGGGNPCCNPGYCDSANFRRSNVGTPVYTGPTTGCPIA